ncbi:MIT protein [Venustampulla echinocandica]|uniref:MIT protein n=1 Tax=Venustampulla echinocandica TaxID=2656787 RepID=A0A370TPL6_9HELO|nr:MIT protein [Venustampulla echinocandica]RDL37466.1 MIT protein [Venustampulla echinocandica]
MSRYATADHQSSLPFHLQPSSDTVLLHQGRQPERGPSSSLPRGRGHVVPSQAQSPQNASRRKPVPTSPESVRGPAATYAHRRSSSLSGVNPGVANLNRWSRSTASSVASTQSTHQKPPSTRRMSVSGSTTFLLGADNSSPPKKAYRNHSSTAYQTTSTRSGLDSSLTLLPPIVTLPSLETSGHNTSSPLTGPGTPSPSTAGILSAAVRSTVPDYFGGTWGDTTPRGIATTADSPSRDNQTSKRQSGEEEKRGSKGHSRHRSGKGSSTGSSNRQSKQPSQKNMLSKALQKANTAVLLDNAQNFEGAMEAYSEACTLLQQVMTRSSGNEDKRKLQAIRNTYTSRINELKRITPHLQDDGKALPERPESGSHKGHEFQLEDEEEEPVLIETATVTRIVNDQSYILDPKLPRSIPTSQLPVRRESLMPSAFDSLHFGGLDPAVQRAHSKSPMRERTLEMNINLAPPMDSTYMPPPLSPRHPPENNTYHGQEMSDPQTTSRSAIPPLRGHARVPSNESMSWLDTIDESGGSTASSVHSRSSSMGVRRKRIRAASGATEAEFDAALDAAVEAAYDDGFEPMDNSNQRDRYNYDDADDDDEIVANVRRKVELAKERVRQTERETAIHDARERERKRLQSRIEPQSSLDDDYGNESEEEERMLEEMTRDYVMDGFEFGLQSKSALPRESDSSGFSGRTWNSSIGSNPTTAGTTLSTVTEAALVPEVPMMQNKATSHPPPAQALPPVPSSIVAPQQDFAPATQGVRGRRLSGQNPKQLKIETTTAPSDSLSQPPSMPPPRVPDGGPPSAVHPKTAGFSSQRPPFSGAAGRGPIPQSARQASSPFPASNSSEIVSPPTPTLARTFTNESDSNGLPRSGSPGRAQSRAGLRKNFSSSSLKNLKSRNLSVSNADDGSDVSPNTPASSQFNPRDMNGRLPAMPTLPTPIAAAFKDKMNGAPAGGLYLFNSDIHSPDSPGSPNPLSADAPIPLEPCPNEFLLRPFWLMRALYQTIAHPRGGYLSTKLFVPRDVWKVKGVKIKSVEDKIANCDFLTAALMKLATVDTFDADAVLEEMQSLEGVLEQVQVTLSKKLGSEVGVQGSGGIFKDVPVGGDAEGNNTSSKSGSTSTKSSFSWRRLRSKNSGAALANTYSNKAAATDAPKEGLSMGTLPMTTTSLAKVRFAKRDVHDVQCSGPNANYMGALARLFDAAQTIDQIARQVEDPGLRHQDKTQVGLELCTRHAAEFFGFYVCRFVLADVALLLDKFIKRGSEWVLV